MFSMRIIVKMHFRLYEMIAEICVTQNNTAKIFKVHSKFSLSV